MNRQGEVELLIKLRKEGKALQETNEELLASLKAAERLKMEFDQLGSEAKQAGKSTKEAAASQADLEARLQSAYRATEAARAVTNKLRSEQRQLAKSGEASQEQIDKLTKALGSAEKAESDLISETRKIIAEYKTFQRETGESARNFDDLNKKLDSAERRLIAVTDAEKAASRALLDNGRAVDVAQASYIELRDELRNTEHRYKQLSAAERESADGRAMVRHIDEVKGKLKELDKSLGDSQRNVGNYASAFDRGLASFRNIAAGLTSVYAALRGGEEVIQAIVEGAELQKQAAEFDNLSRSIGSVSDALLDDLRVASAGMVSDADLVATASDIISLKLATTADGVTRLSSLVSRLGLDMQQLTLTLANDSKARLDSLGISLEDVNAIMQRLQREGFSGDAFDAAVIEALEQRVLLLGDASETTAGDVARLRADIANLVNDLKLLAAVTAGPVISTLSDFSDAVERNDNIDALREQVYEASEALDGSTLNVHKLQEALRDLGLTESQVQDNLSNLPILLRVMQSGMAETGDEAVALAASLIASEDASVAFDAALRKFLRGADSADQILLNYTTRADDSAEANRLLERAVADGAITQAQMNRIVENGIPSYARAYQEVERLTLANQRNAEILRQRAADEAQASRQREHARAALGELTSAVDGNKISQAQMNAIIASGIPPLHQITALIEQYGLANLRAAGRTQAAANILSDAISVAGQPSPTGGGGGGRRIDPALEAAKRALEQEQDELEVVREAVETAQGALETERENLSAARNAAKLANDELDAAEEVVRSAEKSLSRLEGVLKEAQRNAESAQKELDDANAAMANILQQQANLNIERLRDLHSVFDEQVSLFLDQAQRINDAQSELDQAIADGADQVTIDRLQGNLDDAKESVNDYAAVLRDTVSAEGGSIEQRLALAVATGQLTEAEAQLILQRTIGIKATEAIAEAFLQGKLTADEAAAAVKEVQKAVEEGRDIELPEVVNFDGVDTATSLYKDKQAEIAAAREAAQQRIDAADKELIAAQQRVIEEQGKVNAQQKEVDAAREVAAARAKEVADAELKVAAAEQEVAEAQAALKQQQKELASAQKEVAAAQKAVTEAQEKANAAAGGGVAAVGSLADGYDKFARQLKEAEIAREIGRITEAAQNGTLSPADAEEAISNLTDQAVAMGLLTEAQATQVREQQTAALTLESLRKAREEDRLNAEDYWEALRLVTDGQVTNYETAEKLAKFLNEEQVTAFNNARERGLSVRDALEELRQKAIESGDSITEEYINTLLAVPGTVETDIDVDADDAISKAQELEDLLNRLDGREVESRARLDTSTGQSGAAQPGSGVAQMNFAGTDFFGGGMTFIGERGRELVRLPRGSQIYNNATSERIMEALGGQFNRPTITIALTPHNYFYGEARETAELATAQMLDDIMTHLQAEVRA